MAKLLALFSTLCHVTHASYDKIAGYMPGSQVTDHNALDLDQQSIETALKESPVDYTEAGLIYANGGHSKSYAELTVPALASAFSKGTAVVGTGLDGEAVEGSVYSAAAAGDTTLKVGYSTSDSQATHVRCMVGALEAEDQTTDGCFDIAAGITVDGSTTITPTAITNKNGRTLKGFSTGAQSKMYDGCPGCPYFDFLMYYDYYGDFDYADKIVTAALEGTATGFAQPAGQMDFSAADDDARKEFIKKGTAYMNAWMYVVREYEDAIDDCNTGCVGGLTDANCNEYSLKAVHAWDEGVAFYTGSLEGTDGAGLGVMAYALADKRCANFKTCLSEDGLSGTATVNDKLFDQFGIGIDLLNRGKCAEVPEVVRKIVAQMSVPLIQGTLRYAYNMDHLNGGAKEKAEGAIFAAAIVPRVAYCSASDAQTIMSNMKWGAASTDFAAVKSAFEATYSCLNITCADVGGLWFDSNNDYYEDASPCSDASTGGDDDDLPLWAIVVIAVLGGFAVCCLFAFISIYCREKKSGTPVFANMDKSKSPPA